MAAISSVRVFAGTSNRTEYPPGPIRIRLGYRAKPLSKSVLHPYPTDLDSLKPFLESIINLITPILAELVDFLKSGDGAVKYSRKHFSIPLSFTMVSESLILLHCGVNKGKGSSKLIKSLYPLFPRPTRYVIASPTCKFPEELDYFLNVIQSKKGIYQKLSGLPGFPLYEAIFVHNAVSGGSTKALIMEELNCNGYRFMREIFPKLEPQKGLSIKLQIIRKIVDACAVMHSVNIAHLDLKINNIILNVDGEKVQIIDHDFSIDFDAPHYNAKHLLSINIGANDFRSPEVPKGINGFNKFYQNELSVIRFIIKRDGECTWLGETFVHQNFEDGSIFPRVLKKLAFSADVGSLGITIASILIYNKYPDMPWSEIPDLIKNDLDTPMENAFLNIVRKLVVYDYLKRPNIFEVQKMVQAIPE